ncbi:MAG: hypothetical protein KJZ65_10025 [Phycisphaerales bacterium]|nr:hypothetical protein [Phycisphaerales bacterium]
MKRAHVWSESAAIGLSMGLAGAGQEAGIEGVIFIHPEGASAATWTASRAMHVGPDSDLKRDLLPAMAIYRGHLAGSLTPTRNGGGTTPALAAGIGRSRLAPRVLAGRAA